MDDFVSPRQQRLPWNKEKLIGQKGVVRVEGHPGDSRSAAGRPPSARCRSENLCAGAVAAKMAGGTTDEERVHPFQGGEPC